MQPQLKVVLDPASVSSKAGEMPHVAGKNRIYPIDALRGVALLLMALHHTAIFSGTYPGAATYNNLPYTPETFPHWILGLVTHIAAPTFWMLGGASIALFVTTRHQKGVSEWEITSFLLTRAVLIILIDITLGSILWPDTLGNTHVLISLAVSIALLSVVRLLPIRVFAVSTIALLAFYQWFLNRVAHQLHDPQGFWRGLWLTNSSVRFPVLEFPILGWITIMALGYLLGRQLSSPVFTRPYIYVALGEYLLVLWLGLRLTGGYGDLNPYIIGSKWYYFFEMSKSPPSLTYQAFYIGLSMLILAIIYSRANWLDTILGKWLVIIGQVPLFFFIAHPAVCRPLAYLTVSLHLPIPIMAQACLAWLLGMAILVPLSIWYQKVRRKNPDTILRYL